ncbi:MULTISPECIES: T9SS type A sorting domain-containing protein [unclassified Polaribacter]|uniref:T9SS type A sorting domain-containing protein n=1 Tax=unclassified Polaribacter TaxID=196858 RepID=UPI0011BE1F10|nr:MULTISPECIES: T9SS type A sorting domain-containing protein [unclassified Polaribacter]TXD52964.1 T9SS type A sorting domain-containing protein [Polaribacter sp. IC063]TXD60944.1 T9SS type A sorting domain-containing protein [Polaribacter sp. IC066]
MIKKLLFLCLLMLATSIAAQTVNTVTIDWSFNSTPSATGNTKSSRTIEVGDTVIWNWYSGGSHNVQSTSTAKESFESSFFTQGGTFSKTFTQVGTNDYICSPHRTNMFGTITVVAEGTLSIASFDALGTISMYPNPTDSKLTIDFQIQNTEKLNIKVFNLLGKEVLTKQISKNDTSVMVSNLNNGVYIVRITSLNGENSMTKRFVKI